MRNRSETIMDKVWYRVICSGRDKVEKYTSTRESIRIFNRKLADELEISLSHLFRYHIAEQIFERLVEETAPAEPFSPEFS